MPDENKTAKQTVKTVVLKEDNNWSVEVRTFEKGPEAGLKFAIPQAKTVEAAYNRYGADLLLTLVNQGLSTRVGAKVRNTKIPKNLTLEAQVQALATLVASNPDGLIFSTEEAEAYRPGDRGPGFNTVLNDALEDIKAGNLTAEQAQATLLQLASKKRQKKVKTPRSLSL
jgi:hypothetical protein